MLAFAIDHSSPGTVILIAGDRDYVYALSVLRLRRYRVIVLAPKSAHLSLLAQASVHIDWKGDILGKDGSESTGPPLPENINRGSSEPELSILRPYSKGKPP